MLRFWLWLVLLLQMSGAAAVNLEKVAASKGLGRVYTVVQDSAGMTWVGAQAGLFRYDGYTMKPPYLVEPDALVRVVVTRLIYQDDGILWMGTSDGVKKLDMATGVLQHFQTKDAERSGFVFDMVLDANQQLWFGSVEPGLHRIDTTTGEMRHFDYPQPEGCRYRSVYSLLDAGDDQLWVSTCNGYFIAETDGAQAVFPAFQLFNNPGQSHFRPLYFYPDDKQVWVSVARQLYRLDLTNRQFHPIQHQLQQPVSGYSIRDTLAVDDNTLWLATTKGLMVIDQASGQAKIVSNANHQTTALYNDYISTLARGPNGIVWLGTLGGLNQVNTADIPVTHISSSGGIESGLGAAQVLSVMDDGEQIWVGTINGIDVFDRDFNKLHHYADQPNSSTGLYGGNIWAMARLSQDEVLIGTDAGINLVNSKTQKVIHGKNSPDWVLGEPKGRAYHFWIEDRQNVWLATDRGLYIYNHLTGEKRRFKLDTDSDGLNNTRIRTLHRGQGDDLWVGTVVGVNKIDLATGQVKRYGITDWTFRFASGAGQLYVLGDYLYQYVVEQDRFEPVIHKERKLVPASMEVDEQGRLWMSVANRLKVLSLDKGLDKIVATSVNSLKFGESASFRHPDGHLYFGATDGLYAFKPGSVDASVFAPTVHITAVESLCNCTAMPSSNYLPILSLESDSQVEMYARDTGISLRFAASDLTNPQAIRYRYRLLGYEKQFIETTADRREVQYTNLDPGDYQFEVKASNADGVWSRHSTVLSIRVLPHFWQSIWGHAIIVALVLLAFGLLLLWRTSTLKSRAQHLASEVAKRTAQIAEQKTDIEKLLGAREQLIANVSHEFRTPLTLIQGPVDLICEQTEDPHIQSRLQVVKRNSLRLLRMVEQLLAFSSPLAEADKAQALVPDQWLTTMVEPFELLVQNRQMQWHCQFGADETAIAINGQALETIVTNLLSNAVKYSKPGGSVTLQTSRHQQQWQLKVSDTGIGIASQKLGDIFERFNRVKTHHHEKIPGVGLGLALVKSLVDAHQGTIEVQSTEGQGTTVCVRFAVVTDEVIPPPQVQDPLHSAMVMADGQTMEADKNSEVQGARGGIRLLLIEDNRDMCRHIADSLGQGIDIIEAYDGQTGLTMARETLPDIIISDVMMPGMDGLTLCKTLKQDINTSHIPIILLTALASQSQKLEGLASLADEYLNKPFDKHQLRARIDNLLAIRRLLQNRFAQPGAMACAAQAEQGLTEKDRDFLAKFNELVQANAHDCEFGAKDIYGLLAMSERLVQRKLKAFTGQTPVEHIREARLQLAAKLLGEGLMVSQIAEQAGFSSHAYFSNCFKARFGRPPSEFGKTVQLS